MKLKPHDISDVVFLQRMRYEVITMLGKGAYGVVYLVERDGKQYALKVGITYGMRKVDFKQEIKMQDIAAEQGLAPEIYAYEVDNWILMDYLDGYKTLAVLEDELGDEAYELSKRAIRLLKALRQEHGACHSDYHWGNVMYNKLSDDIKIVDWGISHGKSLKCDQHCNTYTTAE